MVYLLVELFTGIAFAGLFWLEIVKNIFDWPGHRDPTFMLVFFPWESFFAFASHAVLFSFLMVATVCDLKSREIPLQLTLTGTLVGLVFSALLPWPIPHQAAALAGTSELPQGMQPWPFWDSLPLWCGMGGNVQTGLLTGILGALVGTMLLRAVAFVFGAGLGKEALGLGDADLMMMTGAFLGWHLVVIAFFLSVFPALIFGIILWVVRRDNSLPFGPALSFSVMACCLGWQTISPPLQPILFSEFILIFAVIFCGSMLFLMSFILRVIRGNS